MKLRWIPCLLLSGLASIGQAADLMQLYRTAQQNDPVFAAAQATREAGLEKLPQGLSGLLPSLSVSGNTTWNNADYSNTSGTKNYAYNSHGYTFSLSQPLFRWQNWVAYEQARFQVIQAEANFVQARQDLILRVAQAYFDVLYATESLAAVRANKVAIAQQLESAKKNFEVGTATITDTHEAQSRHDLASAQEIAAESDLEVKRRTLQAITGEEVGDLNAPDRAVPLATPQPANMADWVASAETQSIPVQLQQAALAIAEREVSKQRAGHYPTLDVVANKGDNRVLTAGSMLDINASSVGLQVTIPLFQGGGVMSRDREASANRRAAESSLENAKRQSALAARQYYLGVVNGLAQVKALRAAMVSSASALESNKLGYEVGVRINIDVLNAENQVYVTRRDLAKATLDTLMAQLRLKAAVANLAEDDLAQINSLLKPVVNTAQ